MCDNGSVKELFPPLSLPQLDFTDFVLEESEGCQYDSLSVFGDFEAREQIGKPTKSTLPET